MRAYGWRPDLPDVRDLRYKAPAGTALPANIDLRASCPKVFDQGQLGSCTANAICAALAFDENVQHLSPVVRSRLFVYYNERAIEGTVGEDAGAAIRDGIKSVAKQGACPESEWPYIIRRFTRKPSALCYTRAVRCEALTYRRLDNADLGALRSCLASGSPFVVGFTVYDSFESDSVASSGVVPMPGPDESVLGGHAVLCVGYDDASQRFLCQNSWGTAWGQGGFFTIPYAYLTNASLADDFWTVTTVGRAVASAKVSLIVRIAHFLKRAL